MRFTDDEIKILKRMSAINPAMSFRTGNKVWSNTDPVKIFMCMDIEDTIPVDFDVGDLGNFIQTIGLMNSEKYQIHTNDMDANIYITDRVNTAQIVKANPLFIKIMQRPIDIPKPDLSFEVTAEEFAKIKKSIYIFDGKQVFLKNTGIVIKDEDRSDKSTFVIKKDFSPTPFEIPFDAELFGMITDSSYKISVLLRSEERPALIKLEGPKFYYLITECVL